MRRLNRLARRLCRCDRGALLVEFVFAIPLIFIVLVVGSDAGRMLISFHTVENSVRAATRYLARAPCAGLTARLPLARNVALRGTVDASGTYVLPNWTDPNTISLVPATFDCAANPPSAITLAANVPLPFHYLSLVGLPSTITVQVRHEERLIGE